jgi:hypothetical protein
MATGMLDCNTWGSPALSVPLGTDADGPWWKDTWHYASAIGMLMYLSSNAHPHIQLAIHQSAQLTHCPQASYKEAVKHNLSIPTKGVKDNGLMFKSSNNLELDCYVDADFARLWM